MQLGLGVGLAPKAIKYIGIMRLEIMSGSLALLVTTKLTAIIQATLGSQLIPLRLMRIRLS